MTSDQSKKRQGELDLPVLEQELVAAVVVDLLPALQEDVTGAQGMWKNGNNKISSGGGYLDTLDRVGLLRWFSAPTKTCGHVTAEVQSKPRLDNALVGGN